MENSFGKTSVLPQPHCILPPEILFHILQSARIADIKNCRLVSSCWNQHGVHVLRKIHPVLIFSSPNRLTEFMKSMPIGPLPFSRFGFTISEDPQILVNFLDKHGSSVRELILNIKNLFFELPRPLTFEQENGCTAFTKFRDKVFCQTPTLQSLRLMLNAAILPTLDGLRPSRHPHLKKLELLVTLEASWTEMEGFIEEIVRRSPVLQDFVIIDRFIYVPATLIFFQHLPKWLKRIPSHIRVGLHLGQVTDSVLPLLDSLLFKPLNLVTLTINAANFEDSTVSDLFSKWLFQQPLEIIEVGPGINWENQNEQNVFKDCKQLALMNHPYSYYQDTSHLKMLSYFPNVTRALISIPHPGTLVLLGTMLPHLEHLSLTRCFDLWEICTGFTTAHMSEVLVGLEVAPTKEDSPFRELRALKSLYLRISTKKDIVPIIYSTKQGMMPSLKRLIISLDSTRVDTRATFTKYGQVLSACHDSVLFKSATDDSLQFSFEKETI